MLVALQLVFALTICCSTAAAPPMTLIERTRFGALDDDISDSVDALLFSMAVDVACGPDGELIVLDNKQLQVTELDRDGRIVGRFGRAGEGPGEFGYPLAIAVDSQGNRYVADSGEIEVFDRDGVPLRTIHSPIAGELVRAIEVAPNGEMYIVAFEMRERMMLHRIDENGKLLRSFCGSFGAGRTDLDLHMEQSFSVGQLDLSKEHGILYSQLAPYSIRRYSLEGELIEEVDHQNSQVQAPYRSEDRGSVRFRAGSTSRAILWLREGGFLNVVSHADQPDGAHGRGSEVEFFDQDGKFLNSQMLSGIVRPCDVDDEGTVWAVAYGDEGSYVVGFTVERR